MSGRDGHFLVVHFSYHVCGENMQDNSITEKILRSMTIKFNYVVCLIKESNNLDTLTLDELQSSLLETIMIHHIKVEEVFEAALEVEEAVEEV
uniref:Uncharacterized protein n=1 Tax=Lactuca sativa TaxID=4236 RepID=A0A9R1VKU5_LACSA|nr:hypothetical protein LSAT_V11C500291790 [Lactuca sativa]